MHCQGSSHPCSANIGTRVVKRGRSPFPQAVQLVFSREWRQAKSEWRRPSEGPAKADRQTPSPNQPFFVGYNKGFRYPTSEFSPSMIRFLQTEGPVKKIVLGGLLLLVCAAMVVSFIPTGSGTFLGELLGANLTTQGVLAKVGSDDITMQEVAQRARMMGRQQFRGNVPP